MSDAMAANEQAPGSPGRQPAPRRRPVILILAVCLAARAGLIAAVRPWRRDVEEKVVLQSDMRDYHELAVALVRHGDLGRQAVRTPGYPAFVAAIYAVFGPRPWAVLLAQALLDTGTCLLVIVIFARFLGVTAALCGGVFYALDPLAVVFSGVLLSEIPFVFLCVLGLYFFSRAIAAGLGPPARLHVPAAALCWALAALTRPILVYLPAVAAAVLLATAPRRLGQAVKHAALLAAAFALVLLPWLVRNYLRFGAPALSASGSYNLLVLHVAPMVGQRRGRDFDRVAASLLAEADAEMAAAGLDPNKAGQFQKAPYWRALALRYIRDDPAAYARHYALGVAHCFVGLGTSWYARQLQLPTGRFNVKMYPNPADAVRQWFRRKTAPEIALGLAVAAFLLATYVCLAVGLLAGWDTRSKPLLWPCLALALYFVLLAGPAGLARFKVPAVPFYLAFSAAGAACLRSRLAGRRRRRRARSGGPGSSGRIGR